MWLYRVTHYLLRHLGQALALAFLITFLPVIGIVGILVAALVTLRKGAIWGAVLTLATIIPYMISFYPSFHHETAVPLVVWAAISVAVSSNVLTWVFASLLRKEVSFSLILQIATLFGVLSISIVHLAYPSVSDWWAKELHAYYSMQTQAITGVLKSTPHISNEMQTETITISKQYATGLMVAAILFNAVLQLIIARWWEAIVFNPGNLRQELHNIRLSPLAGVLFVLGVSLAYLGNSVVLDIMPVLYLLFGVTGLSLIHYFFGLMRTPTSWIWLAALYLLLIFALPVSMMVLAIVALFDIWLDMRKRFHKV